MRILLTVDPEIPVPPQLYGGIERIVDGLACGLRTRGHKVGLLAHPDSECPVDYFQAWTGRASNKVADSLRNTVALLRSVRTFRPDVLHSFSRLCYLLPLLPTRLLKIMSYQRHTGGLRNSLASRFGGSHFVFTACSEHIAGQGRQWGGRWVAIPNFVNTEYYRFMPTVPPDAPLVFLGRIERIKGVHSAIAIARAAGRKLVIAGNTVTTGPDAHYFDQEIAPHLDRKAAEYIGPVNDAQKNELLGRSAALLMPIEWDEPFGIVMVEALACGTPVIAFPRGSVPEVVRDGLTGFKCGTIAESAAAVPRLAGVDRTACRRDAEERFSQRVIVKAYEDLYREMAGNA
jgi:glycosyltransferase involved in cell wall biosynthesis